MKKIVLFLLTAALTACATSGTQLDAGKIDQLKPGISTIADTESLFGQPQGLIHNPDNTTTLMYSYSSEQMDAKSFIPVVGAFVGHAPNVQAQTTYFQFDTSGHYMKWWGSSE